MARPTFAFLSYSVVMYHTRVVVVVSKTQNLITFLEILVECKTNKM